MKEYNAITIEEQNGSTIEQIHIDEPVKIQGYQCVERRNSSIWED